MSHDYNYATHTYLDVKILPEAAEQVVASTKAETSSENGSLIGAGVEYLGQIGELRNHLLYRISKQGPDSDPKEEARRKQIVDALSALHGVVQVDIQVPRQRIKRDEL
ncbi:hypothetical protein BGZ94_009705 [Podila epigama]|nr:hypothetical protein BGZ94_009705 [Podila epigama]